MYPQYSRAERIADGIVHGFGIIASVIAISIVLVLAVPSLNASATTALIIYGLTVVALFSISAAYHMVTHTGAKTVLRRVDQAAIFFKIAGTYTPLVLLVGSLFAYSLLAVVWTMAVAGAVAKIVQWQHIEKYTLALFLALGWVSLTLVWPIFSTMPVVDSTLIVVGGVLYTVGVVFHNWEGLRYQTAIWHVFVLAASACHFTAVTHGTFTLALA